MDFTISPIVTRIIIANIILIVVLILGLIAVMWYFINPLIAEYKQKADIALNQVGQMESMVAEIKLEAVQIANDVKDMRNKLDSMSGMFGSL